MAMTPRLSSLSSSSRTSTVAHVLRLVHNGYLDTSRRAVPSSLSSLSTASTSASDISGIRRYTSSAIGRNSPKAKWRITALPPIISRTLAFSPITRLYSSSAAQTVDHDHDHHHDHSPSAYHYGSLETLRQNELSSRSPLSSSKRFFRSAHYPDLYLCLPERTYKQLKAGFFCDAASFKNEFDQMNLEPRHLGAIGNLCRLFDLFRSTAQIEDWEWLQDKLEPLCRYLEMTTIGQLGALHLACNIRAYALASSGLEYRVKEVLDQAIASTSSTTTHSLSHAIAALANAKVGSWDNAKKEMISSVNRTISRITFEMQIKYTYPKLDLALLQEYEHALLAQDRNQDLVDFIRDSSYEFRHILIISTREQCDAAIPRMLNSICLAAMRRIDHPTAWWLEQYEQDDGPRTRWMGSYLFIAISRNRTRLQEATDLFKTLGDKGVRVPGEAAVEFCWRLFQDARPDAKEILARIRGQATDLTRRALYRAMILAQRGGWIEEEQQMWEELCARFQPTLKDRLALASTYAYRGQVEETLTALRARVGEDFEQHVDALQVLFTANINANNAPAASDLLHKINAISPRLYPFNALLQLYADQVNVNAALALFDQLLDSNVQPDIASYTNLISLFAHRRDPVNANNVFRAMTDAGIQPDAIANAAIINAEVEAGDWSAAARRWASLPEDIRKQRSVLSAIIRALVLLPAPTEQVVELFRKINNPSSRTWASVIQSACDSGDMDLARDLYEEMDQRARAREGPSPDAYTFSILLHGYMRTGDGSSARLVYDEMLKREILPTSVTYGIVISSFTAARGERSLEQAHDFAISVHAQAQLGRIGDRRHIRSMTNQNLFSPLVNAHGQSQNWEEAHLYFDMASQGGQEPSVYMYTQLMDVYRRAGDVDNVFETWKKTFQLALDTTSFRQPPYFSDGQNHDHNLDEEEGEGMSKIRPGRSNDNALCIPLSIVLDTLSTAGRYDDIKTIWSQVQSAGFGFDAGNYNHLCVALARTGDVEGAFMIAQDVLLKRFSEIKSRHHQAVRETANSELPPLADIEPSWAMASSPESSEGESQAAAGLVSITSQDFNDASTTKDRDDSPQLEFGVGIGMVDLPVEPTFSPPNRRHEHQQKSPFTREAKEREDSSELGSKLLRSWRPTDSLWRPSLLTISILDHAYGQLEDARARRSWVPLAVPDEGEAEGEEVEGEGNERMGMGMGIALPLFNKAPLRNTKTGKPTTQDARSFLRTINKKYVKVVALIMFHRRKRQAAKMKAERRR